MSTIISGRNRPSEKYQFILETYYSNRQKDRENQLGLTFDRFSVPTQLIQNNTHWAKLKSKFSPEITDLFSVDDEVTIEISPLLVEQIVKAYLIDLIRYKEYHYNPRDKGLPFGEYAKSIHEDTPKARLLDRDKTTAFLIKWILKIKPIQVSLGSDFDFYDQDLIEKVNYINTDYALMVMANMLQIDYGSIESGQQKMLRHQFQYRPFDENIFSMLFRNYMNNYHV